MSCVCAGVNANVAIEQLNGKAIVNNDAVWHIETIFYIRFFFVVRCLPLLCCPLLRYIGTYAASSKQKILVMLFSLLSAASALYRCILFTIYMSIRLHLHRFNSHSELKLKIKYAHWKCIHTFGAVGSVEREKRNAIAISNDIVGQRYNANDHRLCVRVSTHINLVVYKNPMCAQCTMQIHISIPTAGETRKNILHFYTFFNRTNPNCVF